MYASSFEYRVAVEWGVGWAFLSFSEEEGADDSIRTFSFLGFADCKASAVFRRSKGRLEKAR